MSTKHTILARMGPVLLSALLLLGTLPVTAFAEEPAEGYQEPVTTTVEEQDVEAPEKQDMETTYELSTRSEAVTDWAGLASAISGAAAGTAEMPTEIMVQGTLTADSSITIAGKHIKLVADSGGAAITRADTAAAGKIPLFTVQGESASLTLGDGPDDTDTITIDGGSETNSSKVLRPLIAVYGGGGLTLNSGTLQNNKNTRDENNSHPGGGVFVGEKSTYYSGVTTGTFQMNGGMLKNLFAYREGGGVYLGPGTSFAMTGGAFEGCEAYTGPLTYSPYFTPDGNACGGGIYGLGATVKITGTAAAPLAFTSCSAAKEKNVPDYTQSGSGGAVYVEADDDRTIGSGELGSLTIEYATFTGSKSVQEISGAVYARGLDTLSVTNASFQDNVSTDRMVPNGSAGGLVVISCKEASVSSCTFTNCQGQRGGALRVGGTAKLKDLTITNCEATYGGGVFVGGTGGTAVTMEAVTISNCVASEYGGGVYTDKGEADDFVKLSMTDCSITACTSEEEGGGIYATYMSELLLDSVAVTGCTADYSAGGVYVVGYQGSAAKNAKATLSGDTIIKGNTAEDGANLYMDEPTQTLQVGTLGDGAKIYFSCDGYTTGRVVGEPLSGGALSEADAAKFTCDDANYKLGVSGGKLVIAVNSSSQDPWVQLKAAVEGAKDGDVITVDSAITANAAGGTIAVSTAVTLVPTEGGSIITRGSDFKQLLFEVKEGGTLTIGRSPDDTDGLTLDGNSLTGVYVPLIQVTGGSLILNAGTLQNNQNSSKSNNSGGVLVKNGGTLKMNGGQIKNCSSGNCGGGVASDGAVKLSGGTIQGCSSTNGGGVYISPAGTMTMSGGTIDTCSADTNTGGGLSISGTALLTGGVIKNCTAKWGGAICIGTGRTVALSGCEIQSCSAVSNGGAVYMYGNATLTMSDGKIAGCTSSGGNGGGINTSAGCTVTVSGGTIVDCHADAASKSGGGIYINGGTATISGSGQITRCSAAKNMGGGVGVADTGTLNLRGGSIIACTGAWGGGIGTFDGTIQIEGGKIQGCQAANASGAIYTDSGANISINGGSITGCTAPSYGGLNFTGAKLSVQGDVQIKDNLSKGVPVNVYLDTGKTITVTGALADTADIGLTCASAAADTVVAVPDSGYSNGLTAADAARLRYDGGAYAVALNGEKQAVLAKGVTVSLTVTGRGAAAPAGPSFTIVQGEETTVTLTPDYGHYLSALTLDGADVLGSARPVAGSYRAYTYAFTPEAACTLNITYAPLTEVKLEDVVTGALPDTGDGVTEEEKSIILDVKVDYENMPEENRALVSKEALQTLNDALLALDGVDVEVRYGEKVTGADVSVARPADLLSEMTAKEASGLKAGTISSFLLIVHTELKDDLSEAEKTLLQGAAPGTTVGISYDVTVSKAVSNGGTSTQPLTELKRPISLTFTIPEGLRRTNRTFALYRLHGGAANELIDEAGVENAITVRSDRFSTYVLSYQDASTGGSATRYTITAAAGEHGVITPAGRVRVPRGGSQTFTITPDEGYRIADVLVDGETVGALSSYTFRRVTRAHTIEAFFEKEETDTALLPFIDVHTGDWFYESVAGVYHRGLMLGTSENTFSPDLEVSRGMIATILYRMAGSPEVTAEAVFTDVPADHLFAAGVTWAARTGVVNGYGDGRFGPSDAITREQLATMLYHFAGVPELEGETLRFLDRDRVSDYARPAMTWAVGQGIVTGKGDGILDPGGRATRAQAAAMVMRYLEKKTD